MTKIFVSVDAEGMPWVPGKQMLMPGDQLFNELREIMTSTTNILIKLLFDNGASEAIVADSHGSMLNIIPFKLDERATLLRGYPRPLSMIVGAEKTDGAIFLGYHTSPQLGGVLAHTYAGRIIQRVVLPTCNETTEYLLNAYALGEMGVPVIMVAGDSLLEEHVKKYTPWAEFVGLKHPVSFFADLTPPPKEIEKKLEEAVKNSMEKLSNNQAKPLVPPEPWIEVEFKRPFHADVAELFPCVERKGGTRVKLVCKKYIENLKLLEGIIAAAYSYEKT